MPSSRVQRIAFAVLALICLVNANGLTFMLTGTPQIASVPLLLCCVILTHRTAPKRCLSTQGLAFLGSIFLYLILGSIYSLINNDASQGFIYLASHTPGLFLIYATASYVSQLTTESEKKQSLSIVAWSAFFGSSSVFFSEFLFSLYKYPPLDTYRFSGFFANANEAGIVSLISFLFMLWLSHENRHPKYLLCALVSATAVFLTFSKSCIVGLVIVTILYTTLHRKLYATILVAVLFATIIVLFTSSSAWMDGLTISQARRVNQVILILSGEISDETTTGRTELWAYGLSLAAEQWFVLGRGLDSFHHLKGFMLENGVWQGVHNTYLMILGEAGLPAFIAFLVSNIALLYALWRERLFYLLIYIVILQIDFLSAHNVITLRPHNLLIGFTLGTLAYTHLKQKARPSSQLNFSPTQRQPLKPKKVTTYI